MTATTTAIRTIDSIERLRNSTNGNPRFRLHFTDGSSAVTKSDASWGYSIGNPGLRDGSRVVVTFNASGTTIRDIDPAR